MPHTSRPAAATRPASPALDTPEHRVLATLAQRNWQVLRNFWVFDPQTSQYGACDIVAVSAQALVMAHITRWTGEWQAADHTGFPRWKKRDGSEDKPSPAFQLCTARDLLLKLIQRDFMSHDVDLKPLTLTCVVMEPGKLINILEPEQTDIWQAWQVNVGDLAAFARLLPPQPVSPVPATVLATLTAYAAHFRIKDPRSGEGVARVRKLQDLQLAWELMENMKK